MGLTTDRNDPGLKNIRPDGQQEVYLVLSEEERAKGFVRPVRSTYRHVGIAGPQYPLRDLDDSERKNYSSIGYVKFEDYPQGDKDKPSTLGRYWTQEQLDKIGKGCGQTTSMGEALAETYAREPRYYGATFCCTCGKHLPVGPDGEFVWVENGQDTTRVGT